MRDEHASPVGTRVGTHSVHDIMFAISIRDPKSSSNTSDSLTAAALGLVAFRRPTLCSSCTLCTREGVPETHCEAISLNLVMLEQEEPGCGLPSHCSRTLSHSSLKSFPGQVEGVPATPVPPSLTAVTRSSLTRCCPVTCLSWAWTLAFLTTPGPAVVWGAS